MACMRELKLRIKSISETQKITKAMKLISAAKLKKARQQLDQTRTYFTKVETIMANILANSIGINQSSIYFKETGDSNKKTGIIVLTGDKGMAGSYNHNIIKLSEDMINDAENPVLFIAGAIGKNYFSRKNYNLYEDFDYPVQNPVVKRAKNITDLILEKFKNGELDEVYLAYTEMVSSIKLVPQAIRLLPLNLGVLKSDIRLSDSEVLPDGNLNYEPSPEKVFEVLIAKYIKGVIYGAFVEAFTSEQSARMTAMDSATNNAQEMLEKLELRYNRARQAAITQEISEIVGGASAL
ncbi:MAG: ATP synthase F1 subunit gamma [Bacillota bacterium]|nr:ATP synthase F1 subunit gamma [Bacillota bacterium]